MTFAVACCLLVGCFLVAASGFLLAGGVAGYVFVSLWLAILPTEVCRTQKRFRARDGLISKAKALPLQILAANPSLGLVAGAVT